MQGFLQFRRRLRLAVFFHRLEKENEVDENQVIRVESEEIVYEEPWIKPSTFNPKVGQNEALESFLFELEKYLFDPRSSRKIKDNLTQLQRRALKRLSTWNLDPLCDHMSQHPTYVEDEGHFLQYIEDLNEMREPFEPNSVLLVSMDIKDFYPSCNTEKCFEAVKILLDSRENKTPVLNVFQKLYK